MRRLAWLALLALFATQPSDARLLLIGGGSVTSPEEFVGPLAGWQNVKSSPCNAHGDGSTNDTSALTTCIGLLGSSVPVLYFPCGTYPVTGLTMSTLTNVSWIGQSKACVTIKYTGTLGGALLSTDTISYSNFSRITFDGNSLAAIDVSERGPGTGNQYADDVFKGTTAAAGGIVIGGVTVDGIGYFCGLSGSQCSENEVLRGQFLNNPFAGVATENGNALDIWVWDSLFNSNNFGATNAIGGHFFVYRSLFENSSAADINWYNVTNTFAFRYNYSLNSNQFIGRGGAGNAGGSSSQVATTLQSNTIINPGQLRSVFIDNAGPLIMLGNTINSGAGSGTMAYLFNGLNHNAGILSYANTYSVTSPLQTEGFLHSVNDVTATVTPPVPTLPGEPSNFGRAIFEASPSGSGSTCSAGSPCSPQTAITQAAAACSNNVAHLRAGTYTIMTTITAPSNCAVQIVGDGLYSVLHWSGGGAGPVLQLAGPTKATLRDFLADGNSTVDGIEVDNADQSGSQVFVDQPFLFLNTGVQMLVDHLDHTNVEVHSMQHTQSTGTGLSVIGGASAHSGAWLGGKTNVIGALSFGEHLVYSVSNGGRLIVRDMFYDAGGGSGQVANVTDNGVATFDNGFSAGTGSPAMNVNNFSGTAALVAQQNNGGNVTITGTGGGANVLAAGLIGSGSSFFSDTSSPAATHEFLNGYDFVGSTFLTETSESDAFVAAALAQDVAAVPLVVTGTPNGVTDLRMYRVSAQHCINGVHLVH